MKALMLIEILRKLSGKSKQFPRFVRHSIVDQSQKSRNGTLLKQRHIQLRLIDNDSARDGEKNNLPMKNC